MYNPKKTIKVEVKISSLLSNFSFENFIRIKEEIKKLKLKKASLTVLNKRMCSSNNFIIGPNTEKVSFLFSDGSFVNCQIKYEMSFLRSMSTKYSENTHDALNPKTSEGTHFLEEINNTNPATTKIKPFRCVKKLAPANKALKIKCVFLAFSRYKFKK